MTTVSDSEQMPAPMIKPGGRNNNNTDDGKNKGVQTSHSEDRILNQIMELKRQLRQQRRNKRNKQQQRDKRADKSTLLYGNLQTSSDDCGSMPGSCDKKKSDVINGAWESDDF